MPTGNSRNKVIIIIIIIYLKYSAWKSQEPEGYQIITQIITYKYSDVRQFKTSDFKQLRRKFDNNHRTEQPLVACCTWLVAPGQIYTGYLESKFHRQNQRKQKLKNLFRLPYGTSEFSKYDFQSQRRKVGAYSDASYKDCKDG